MSRLRFKIQTKYVHLERCDYTYRFSKWRIGSGWVSTFRGAAAKGKEAFGLNFDSVSSYAQFRKHKISEYVPCDFASPWWPLSKYNGKSTVTKLINSVNNTPQKPITFALTKLINSRNITLHRNTNYFSLYFISYTDVPHRTYISNKTCRYQRCRFLSVISSGSSVVYFNI